MLVVVGVVGGLAALVGCGGYGGPGDCHLPPPRTWIVSVDAGDAGSADGGADACFALCGTEECTPLDGGAAVECVDQAWCGM